MVLTIQVLIRKLVLTSGIVNSPDYIIVITIFFYILLLKFRTHKNVEISRPFTTNGVNIFDEHFFKMKNAPRAD